MLPSLLHSPPLASPPQLDLVDQFSFLDVSLEDDSLLPSGNTDEFNLSSDRLLHASVVVETGNISLGVEPVDASVQENYPDNQSEADCESLADQSMDILGPLLTEEPVFRNKMKKNGFNLRKSLAWNNAFLTEEGVLDSEELSLVNKTFQKNLQRQSRVNIHRQPSKAIKMPNVVMIPKINPTSLPPHRANTNIDAQSVSRMQAGSPRSSAESLSSTETKRAEGNGPMGVVRRVARKPPSMLTAVQEKPVAQVSQEDHPQKKKRTNASDSTTSVHSQLPAKPTSGRPRSQAVSITAVKTTTSGVTMATVHGNKPGPTCKDRPSGLRLPSPKLGFFDTARLSSQVGAACTSESADSRMVATNKSDVDGNSGKRITTGLRRPGIAVNHRPKQVSEASGVNSRVGGNDISSSSIPLAPNKRNPDFPVPGSTRSAPPFSFTNRKADNNEVPQVLQAKNTIKNVSVRGKLTGIRSVVNDGSGQENSHPECREK